MVHRWQVGLHTFFTVSGFYVANSVF
jgi:hypothetical protein